MTWGKPTRGRNPHRLARAPGAVLAALGGLMLATPAQAQSAPPGGRATKSGTATVAVVAPLSLVKTQDMDFAKIAPAPTAGTVTINANTDVCTKTGAILQFGQCRTARFTGMGSRNLGARISLTSNSNLTGPGQTMVLDQIVLGTNSSILFIGNINAVGGGVGLTAGGGNQRYTITSPTGIFEVRFGGRLTVNANQAPGRYNGTITVNVQYQ